MCVGQQILHCFQYPKAYWKHCGRLGPRAAQRVLKVTPLRDCTAEAHCVEETLLEQLTGRSQACPRALRVAFSSETLAGNGNSVDGLQAPSAMLASRGPGAQFFSPVNVTLGQLIAQSGAVSLHPAVHTWRQNYRHVFLPVTVPVVMEFTHVVTFP